MYETYWNLLEKPFQNTADPKFFFYSETYEEAYIRLLYSVTESKGLMLLTGNGGCGKTFLCKAFFKEMVAQGYKVALITNPDFTPQEFLQQVLCEYGLSYGNKSKVELLKDLQEFVIQNAEANNTTVLIIDEAQLIRDERTLEEVRLLLNFETTNNFPLSIVLSGKPEFTRKVKNVSSLYDRVGLQYRLQPLNCRETGEYICQRMDKAGCSREVFTADAIKLIHNYSGGVPRQINHICDLALLLGYGDACIVVDSVLIQKAVDDLRGITTTAKKHSDLKV